MVLNSPITFLVHKFPLGFYPLWDECLYHKGLHNLLDGEIFLGRPSTTFRLSLLDSSNMCFSNQYMLSRLGLFIAQAT